MFSIDNKITYEEIFQYANKVYQSLEDELSRNIFEKRMIYNMTKTKNSLDELCKYNGPLAIDEHIPKLKKIFESNFFNKAVPTILYGAGEYGEILLNEFINNDIDNIIFCDKNADKIKEIKNFKVITPTELIDKYKDNKIVITSYQYSEEIYQFLIEHDFTEKNIVKYEICNYMQYFETDIIKLSEEEIFIDAGVLDGITSKQLANLCHNKYKHIYLFEPDKESYENLIKDESFMNLENKTLFNIGVWNKKETLQFRSNSERPGGNRISDEGNTSIEVDTIDNILRGGVATFIKMDIEGAELNALKGAEETIKKYKPKLAISLYHKPCDIIDIPLYIKSIVPEYKLYIRHYGMCTLYPSTETVLYAIL